MSKLSDYAAGRARGERQRLEHELERMRALIDALESSMRESLPLSEHARAVADAGTRVSMLAASHDAADYIARSKP